MGLAVESLGFWDWGSEMIGATCRCLLRMQETLDHLLHSPPQGLSTTFGGFRQAGKGCQISTIYHRDHVGTCQNGIHLLGCGSHGLYAWL